MRQIFEQINKIEKTLARLTKTVILAPPRYPYYIIEQSYIKSNYSSNVCGLSTDLS